MYLITRISSHIQDERGFDIAGMVNGLLPAVPGLITSIANAAKGGVSDIVLDKMPYWITHQVIISRTHSSVRKFEVLELCTVYWAINEFIDANQMVKNIILFLTNYLLFRVSRADWEPV